MFNRLALDKDTFPANQGKTPRHLLLLEVRPLSWYAAVKCRTRKRARDSRSCLSQAAGK
jgi:hypothetical protein